MSVRRLSALYFVLISASCIQEARLDPGVCADGEALCDGRCIDVRSDYVNCGACGVTCAEDEVCDLGSCGSTCSGGLTACEGACVDARFDPSHCGSCGNVCDAGLLCSEGSCSTSCTGGTTECNGLCVDSDFDPMNCGDCGVVCDSGLFCSQGVCALDCTGGTVKCGAICTNTDFDPAHCGDCQTSCAGATNAAASCSNGICDITCNADFGDCDGSSDDGCETDLRVTADHCGECTTMCPEVANGERGCGDSSCEVASCEPGWDDCDTLLLSGCETRTDFDVAHCGDCGNPCAPGDFCVAGDCTDSVLFAADGRYGSPGNLYIVDPAIPEAIAIQALANAYVGLQWVSGTLYGITRNGALFSINPLTGGETLIGDVAAIGVAPRDLALRPDGTLLACNGSSFMVAIDRFSAVGTQLVNSASCTRGAGFAEDADGNIYQLAWGTLSTVDSTGVVSVVADTSLYSGYKGLTFHEGTLYAYSTWYDQLVTVNPESGVVTQLGPPGAYYIHAMTSTSPF